MSTSTPNNLIQLPARGRQQPAPQIAVAQRRQAWIASTVVMLGMMLTIFTSTMVNVAVPNIMGAYGIGQDQVHWMSTGFLSAMTVSMLMNAWCVANLGIRNTFLLSMTVFVLASFAAQFSPGYDGMVVARVVQGMCAGLLQPLALSVIFPAFAPEERGKVMGIYGMGIVLGPALGPTFGGFIVDHTDWRLVFSAAAPLCVILSAVGLRFLPGRDEKQPVVRLNWYSLALVALAVGALLNAISNGQRLGWDSVYVLGLFTLSIAATVIFAVIEANSTKPLLQVRLFMHRTFAITSIVGFVFGAGMFGSIYLLPIFVQTIQGFSASDAGFILMFAGLILVPIFPVAGSLSRFFAPGWPMAVGMTLFAVSSYFLSFADINASFWFLAGWAAFGRVGLGLVVPSMNTGALASVPPEMVSYGAGTLNFIRMTGGAIGTSTLAIFLDQRTAYHADLFKARQGSNADATGTWIQETALLLQKLGMTVELQKIYALGQLARATTGRAAERAFQDGFILLAIAFMCAALIALLLTRKND